ncbi:MAG: hypothetical protein AMXMBFR25_18250 [Lysobacterales bacterium]
MHFAREDRELLAEGVEIHMWLRKGHSRPTAIPSAMRVEVAPPSTRNQVEAGPAGAPGL